MAGSNFSRELMMTVRRLYPLLAFPLKFIEQVGERQENMWSSVHGVGCTLYTPT